MNTLSEYLRDDPEFARELVMSFSDNLIEFRESLIQATQHQDSSIFLKSHHKLKTTLSYTKNERLQQLADHIKEVIQQQGIRSIQTKTRNAFCRLCNNSIADLKTQLNAYLNMSL